jgi:hypothetical protein
MKSSLVAGVYDQAVDRESAYEKLMKAAIETTDDQEQMQAAGAAPPAGPVGPSILEQVVGGLGGRRTHRSDTVIEALTKSMVRSIGSTAGREIARGIMGSIFGGMKRR